jgi:tRNA threonylcarbamoyladenosine biosynthesis protein TsaE
MPILLVADESAMRAIGSELSRRLRIGDVVLLEGDLGAGKTTLARGILEGLGFPEFVRSPTFNLIQTYPTDPPVLHADLYRVQSYRGLGIEDYLDTHICLVEWPDRAVGLVEPDACWRISIQFGGPGREVEISLPDRLKSTNS